MNASIGQCMAFFDDVRLIFACFVFFLGGSWQNPKEKRVCQSGGILTARSIDSMRNDGESYLVVLSTQSSCGYTKL